MALTLTDKKYIASNFYDEVRKRGTLNPFLKKGYRSPTNQTGVDYAYEQKVNGELLRMINCEEELDEFIFHLFKRQEIGWWIDCSSPGFKGNTQIDSQINKSLLNDKDFTGEESYDKNEGVYTGSSTTSITDGDKKVLNISTENGDYVVKNIINDGLDYELTFFIKTSSTFTVTINPSDTNSNALTLKNKDGDDITDNKVIDGGGLLNDDNYYFIRFILYGKNTKTVEEKTNIGIGYNGIIPEGSVKCEWKIESEDAYLWDVKIKPLKRPYETGFIQPANWIEIYLANKNGTYNLTQIKDYIRNYLIPYNSTLSLISLLPVDKNVTGVNAIISINTGDLFGNLTMNGEEYVDPVNSTIQIIDMSITEQN